MTFRPEQEHGALARPARRSQGPFRFCTLHPARPARPEQEATGLSSDVPRVKPKVDPPPCALLPPGALSNIGLPRLAEPVAGHCQVITAVGSQDGEPARQLPRRGLAGLDSRSPLDHVASPLLRPRFRRGPMMLRARRSHADRSGGRHARVEYCSGNHRQPMAGRGLSGRSAITVVGDDCELIWKCRWHTPFRDRRNARRDRPGYVHFPGSHRECNPLPAKTFKRIGGRFAFN
jgi:hypothetical protein